MSPRVRKTVANPEYYEQESVIEEFKERLFMLDGFGPPNWRGIPRELSSHFPEDYDLKLPAQGTWIMVKHPPHAEIEVPPMSMWFAKETIHKGNGPYFKRHLARIVTPEGSLDLYPDEYVLVRDIRQYVGCERDGVYVHPLGGTGGLPEETVFYAMSRGISRSEAILLLIDELTESNALYFTVDSELAAIFGYAHEAAA